MYMLQITCFGVCLLAGCCERVFLFHGEDSPIIHHCCPPWTSSLFMLLLLFENAECSCYLSCRFVLFLKPNNCLFRLHGEILLLHDVGLQQQLPKPLRINSRTFTCFNWCRNNDGIVHICPWNCLWSNCLWSNYNTNSWKWWDIFLILKKMKTKRLSNHMSQHFNHNRT